MGWCSMTPRDRDLLKMIGECTDRIAAYVQRAGDRWIDDDMAVDAIAKRLEEIGELAKRLSAETLVGIPSVDWRGVGGLREILAHDYDRLDADLILNIVDSELPGLRVAVATALAD